MPALVGDAHPTWRGGTTVNDKGYLRVTAGPGRHSYVHRRVIEQLLLEQEVIRRVEAVLTGEIGPAPWEPDLTLPQLAAREALDVVSNPPRLPAGRHVHHTDGDKHHNCPQNLMVLDSAIHDHLTQAHRRFLRRHHEQEVRAKLRGEAI